MPAGASGVPYTVDPAPGGGADPPGPYAAGCAGRQGPDLKILNCIHALDTGGAQRQLSYLAPALVERGHEVHAAYLRGGSNLSRLDSGRVVLHRLRSLGNHDPFIFVQLAALMRRIRPDIVQTWILQMDILG
ncbi:MAG: glycosyltransferase, partial [Deltaproteobacteria bacterium]